MRIAFFHELHFGGARRVVFEYAKVFYKQHEIELFYVDKEKEEDVERYFRKSNFYKLKFRKYTGGDFLFKIYKDFIEPFKLYALHKRIAAEIDNQKFDFVFVHPSQFTQAPFILRFLKTPVAYFCHEPLRTGHDPVVKIPENISLLKRIYERFNRWVRVRIDSSNLGHANLVLTNCEYSRKNIKKAYGIDARVCYLGVDPSVFKPLGLRKEYDLIFVGDSIPMEGYDTLEEILKLFKNKPKVKIVQPKKDKYISDGELAGFYNKSKILLVLGRFDPFSMIPWEGMSSGIPPIVVKEGGPVEAVKEGKTGFIIERNPLKFKKKIELLLSDNDLRERIGKAGRADVLKYWNWQKSSDRVLEIVNRDLL